MKRIVVLKLAVLLLTLPLIGCLSKQETVHEKKEHKPLVAFLVRHAEKADSSDDPPLTAAGRERAEALARTLHSAKIEYVHSSDYIRCRDTAAPAAADHALEVHLYDPRDLAALATKLRETGGRHLVVGHSNTTPPLAELLGGEPGPAIDEAAEYDRLYIVTVGKDGAASTVLMRYGIRFEPGRQ